jgi:hypothetical protein
VRAVLEEEPYRSRLTFEVFGWETEKGLRAKQDYAFGADGHGLVVLGADGRLLTCRPGHSYGAREIRDDFDRALGR